MLWHAGTGCDGDMEWNRFDLIKQAMGSIGLEMQTKEVESNTQKAVKGLWEKQLQML
jgi:hypothetical protein